MAAPITNIDDPSSLYFLRPADGPRISLVTQLLGEDNYVSWSRAMLISLSVKNKLGFIDGSIPPPPATDARMVNVWLHNNNVVISWILNSVTKEIQASIIYSTNAKDSWDDLKSCFQRSNGPRIFQLRRDLANLTQDQTSVNVYFTKLKSIWEELGNFRYLC